MVVQRTAAGESSRGRTSYSGGVRVDGFVFRPPGGTEDERT